LAEFIACFPVLLFKAVGTALPNFAKLSSGLGPEVFAWFAKDAAERLPLTAPAACLVAFPTCACGLPLVVGTGALAATFVAFAACCA
jgi:hypothetical protein